MITAQEARDFVEKHKLKQIEAFKFELGEILKDIKREAENGKVEFVLNYIIATYIKEELENSGFGIKIVDTVSAQDGWPEKATIITW